MSNPDTPNQTNPSEQRQAVLDSIQMPEPHADCKLVLAGPDDIAAAKKLDDLAFGAHQGVAAEEFEQIIEHGALVLLKDGAGKLVGEAQLVLEQIPHLKYKLADNEAYAYGTAIDPAHQGEGLGQITGQAQRLLAAEAGKDTLVLTVRAENMASLRSRFKQGFTIESFDPEYYGPMPDGGARVIMKSPVENPTPAGTEDLELLKSGAIPVYDGESIGAEALAVYVHFGDGVDLSANEQIQALVAAGYRGKGLYKASELETNGSETEGVLVFKKR
jgi:ribosomal protein S18 acetylase RimI-like enzyme